MVTANEDVLHIGSQDMKDDPIWNGLLLIAVVVCSVVALYPGWTIKILSYGRKTTQDINARLLVTTRIMAAIGVLWGVAHFIWGIIRK
jgi:hypothetical protein